MWVVVGVIDFDGWGNVAYALGIVPPKGNEDAMFAIAEAWNAAADKVEVLIPDLARVRNKTLDDLSALLWPAEAL